MAGFTLTVLDGSMPFLAFRSGTDVTPVTPSRSIKASKDKKLKV
jgi:hypothetical protein